MLGQLGKNFNQSAFAEKGMRTKIIEKPILIEEKNLTFSSGGAIVNGKDDYHLVNAYVINRGTSENNSYAIVSIYERTNGTYRLQNTYAGLNSGAIVRLIWVRK